jgi:hypothetical protein
MRLLPAIIIAALIFSAAGCEKNPEGYDEALADFDEIASVMCPEESRLGIARSLDARTEDVRVIHYGPTGQGDHTYYFAALSRDGRAGAGIFDEAWARIPEEHYKAEFSAEEFVWAVKCVRNDPPFADRQVRYGTPVPVKIEYGTRDVAVEFVDGWLDDAGKWSTGLVRVNLAGTTVLEEEHGLDFAFRGGGE